MSTAESLEVRAWGVTPSVELCAVRMPKVARLLAGTHAVTKTAPDLPRSAGLKGDGSADGRRVGSDEAIGNAGGRNLDWRELKVRVDALGGIQGNHADARATARARPAGEGVARSGSRDKSDCATRCEIGKARCTAVDIDWHAGHAAASIHLDGQAIKANRVARAEYGQIPTQSAIRRVVDSDRGRGRGKCGRTRNVERLGTIRSQGQVIADG